MALLAALLVVGCSSSSTDGGTPDAGGSDGAVAASDAGGSDATVPIGTPDAGASKDASSGGGSDATADATPVGDASTSGDGGVSPDASQADADTACSTRIAYGSGWIAPANHPNSYDVIAADVTWDGTCTDDGSNSYATLSNGWKPYFTGNGACVMAFDYTGACANVPSSCSTRISYGPAWIAPANHSASYDDVTGRVFGDGACSASGSNSQATLSNGWTPTFSGSASCRLSFRYEQCGGLYKNAVVPSGCADPGVLRDGSTYVLTCTSGDAADAYPIFTSPDLANWTAAGHVFPSGHWPTWAKKDFWAPEIHKVGSKYVVYFSARGADNMLAIGAASANSALGPFTDIGAPLIHDAAMGLIDASEINAPQGPYVLWKEDGNALGKPTPIHAQPLAADGLSITGSPSTLITNDQAWEGAVTEGPFMVEQAGSFYLFYSGNSYANATYAVGVARASSPTGPFTKASGPILTTNNAWVGPGHCSVVDTPTGDTAIVYHAWVPGCVNTSGCGRLGLLDTIAWQNGWPAVQMGPSSNSRPLP